MLKVGWEAGCARFAMLKVGWEGGCARFAMLELLFPAALWGPGIQACLGLQVVIGSLEGPCVQAADLQGRR